jgi:hypothetical protein
MGQKEKIWQLKRAIEYTVNRTIESTYYDWVVSARKYESLVSESKYKHFQALMDSWTLLYLAGLVEYESYSNWYDGYAQEQEKIGMESETPF